ncbi:MAG: thiopurine S-methyltransferase [Gammaproteobacteria bacterium]
MHADFWHERWRSNEIGFHESQPNALFVRYVGHLSLEPGSRVFLPLCGKTRDIGWSLAQGFRVSGIELSRDAVEQLFDELGLTPTISDHGELQRFSADDLDIFVGDIFALSADLLGPVDASYDRAALVALPEDMRRRYAVQLEAITHSAPQLLICFEYDQSQMAGPPFSITRDEVVALYGDHYRISRLAAVDVPGGLKGQCAATEVAWLLQKV